MSKRATLALCQAALVRALTDNQPTPAGVDPQRLLACAAALARKRRRAVELVWPGLTRELGGAFSDHFDEFAAQIVLPGKGGPLADGRAFARWLAQRGALPDAGRIEALYVDLQWVSSAGGLVRRRGPVVCCRWLSAPRRLVVALRLPWWGQWCWTLPWFARFF